MGKKLVVATSKLSDNITRTTKELVFWLMRLLSSRSHGRSINKSEKSGITLSMCDIRIL